MRRTSRLHKHADDTHKRRWDRGTAGWLDIVVAQNIHDGQNWTENVCVNVCVGVCIPSVHVLHMHECVLARAGARVCVGVF